LGSEKENGDVKITKRFGIPGKWESLSEEEVEQRITQEEQRGTGNTNGKTVGSSPFDNSDCLVPAEDVEAAQEYYNSPEYMEALSTHEAEEAERLAERAYVEAQFGPMELERRDHFENLARTDKLGPKYPKHSYLLEGVFPENEVHVISGPSGSGKSSWLFKFIDRWQRESDVFGRKTHWKPYCIISNDRSKASIMRTLERLKLNPRQFNVQETITAPKNDNRAIIEKIHAANPLLKVVFLEGLHSGLQDSNAYEKVASHMRGLNALCQKLDITIIATTHTAKGNSYGARQAAIGSVATSAFTEAAIQFQPIGKKKIKLTVSTHNSPDFEQWYAWTETGDLLETAAEAEVEIPSETETLTWDFLLSISKGEEFRTADWHRYFTKTTSQRTSERALEHAKDTKLIYGTRKGRWVKA
jgi:AAA domain